MSAERAIVIVGASAAGLTCAETLRQGGHVGPLCLVGDEPHLPYDRPPLSKQVLAGDWPAERTALRPVGLYPELELDLRLGRRATALDLDARQVTLADGTGIDYDALVIATGVAPRPLPHGQELDGVHVLRTLDDAIALRADLARSERLVVVGAGVLGCEVAATARRLGVAVTLVDVETVPLRRVLGASIGSLVADLHREHGVELRLGVGIEDVTASAGRATGVRLADGSTCPADSVLAAIGCAPAIGWLAGSGLTLVDGVECDPSCRAAADVYAAGDVANVVDRDAGTHLRVEHRMNASEQGALVARNLLGAREAASAVPFFWTDQYDAKIQVYGTPSADADVEIVDGDVDARRFVAAYREDGRVTAVLGWNAFGALRKHRGALLHPSLTPSAPA